MHSPSSVNIDIEKNNMLSVHVPGFLPLMFTTMGYIWGTVGGLPDGNIFMDDATNYFKKMTPPGKSSLHVTRGKSNSDANMECIAQSWTLAEPPWAQIWL